MEIVLNTYGTSINRDNEAFVITNEMGRRRVPPDGISRIVAGKGVSITTDAMLLAIEHEIEILVVDRRGQPQGMVWSHKYGSISTIRKGQLEFTRSSEAVTWVKGVVRRKIENQQAMLLMGNPASEGDALTLRKAIARLGHMGERLDRVKGERIGDVAPQLRGMEGTASRIYFSALNLLLPEEYRFEERSQHPARDVANALLNYGYGMLYGKVEMALIRAGADPYIGVLHRDEYNKPVLAYDLIEPYRAWVDYVVFALLAQRAVTADFCSMDDDGACWLENMGRRVLIQSLNDYMEEAVTIDGTQRSREHHIFLAAQALAQRFKALC